MLSAPILTFADLYTNTSLGFGAVLLRSVLQGGKELVIAYVPQPGIDQMQWPELQLLQVGTARNEVGHNREV